MYKKYKSWFAFFALELENSLPLLIATIRVVDHPLNNPNIFTNLSFLHVIIHLNGLWYNRDGFISISHQRVVCRIIRRRSAFNRLFRPILKTFQGIYKSSVKADPNRIIFSSGVFGTSWKVVDATAKFLNSIKLTTQARAILTGCLEFTYIFKVCWTNMFASQFKYLYWFACYPTELQL